MIFHRCFLATALFSICLFGAGCASNSAHSQAGAVDDAGHPTAERADGRIVRVNRAENLAYISLTKKDRIAPGMTFSCFDPHTGLPPLSKSESSETSTIDPIGRIEVIEVGDTSSLCRITGITGRLIQAGDLISNRIYHISKTRPIHFVVAGDFDLNGDGVPIAAERDRLIRMLISWGGQVDQEVTVRTDYLVMGARPASPALKNTAAEAAGSTTDERAKQQTDYDRLIASASRLSIPVLNYNRVRALIGN